MRITSMLAAAVAALASTVGIAAGPAERFTHAGRTYTYTRTVHPDGRQVIAGRSLPGNRPFRLVVRGDRVRGTVDRVPVGFRTTDARGAAAGIEIAAR